MRVDLCRADVYLTPAFLRNPVAYLDYRGLFESGATDVTRIRMEYRVLSNLEPTLRSTRFNAPDRNAALGTDYACVLREVPEAFRAHLVRFP